MCPCGSNAIYGVCCGPFHSLEAFARDPVPMTRARFSAFSMANADYIIDTTYYKHKDYKRYLENNENAYQRGTQSTPQIFIT